MEPVEIQRGEAIELRRPRSPPEPFTQRTSTDLPGQRIGGGDLCRRVPTAEVRDAQVGSEEVGAIAQQLGLGEARGMRRIPAIRLVGRPPAGASGALATMRPRGRRRPSGSGTAA